MKNKIIFIFFGAILLISIIFIVKIQGPVEAPEKIEPKITQTATKEPVQPISKQEVKKKVVVSGKVSTLGKMPDPSDKAAMEDFFNKAFMAWNDKVASLIINDLKLGQDALDKYSKIRDDFYESQFSLFQVQTAQEPQGSENKEGQRRLATTTKNAKEILERDFGINLDTDDVNAKEDYPKIQQSIEKAMKMDSDKFLGDHLKDVKNVLGKDGYKKYEGMKNDFNNEITEEGADPLFKI